MNKNFLSLTSLFFLFYSFLWCQNTILLINADSVVGYKINESSVRDFVGNVHLRQGRVDLFCNKAIHYIEENKAILFGSVKIVQDTLVLISEYIEYDGNKSIASSNTAIEIKDPQNYLKAKFGSYNFKTRVANFYEDVYYEEKKSKLTAKNVDYDRSNQIIYAFGKVRLETDSLLLFSDTLVYSKSNNVLNAYSNVYTKGKYEPLEVFCGKLFFDRKNNFSKSYENPRLILVDTIKIENDTNAKKLDSLFLFADTLFSQRDNDGISIKFTNSVRLFKGELTSKGDYGILYRNKGVGFLVGSPQLWYDSTEFRGDSLFFVFKDNKVSLVEFIRNALILSPSNIDTSYIQKIQSDTIKVFFSDNKIDYILGIGNSKTNYFLKNDETGEIQLANYISESVIISFVNNEVDNVLWKGNVSGEVIPKIIFEKNIDKYYSYPKDFLKNKPLLY
ncbi:MAG: LPS export ABC transporter periplasmic protein LptC [Ignavibacteria bacterium]|nr:LPS export ABC transporter periplasmic protein LptC [Ignavibacteria bacterium]